MKLLNNLIRKYVSYRARRANTKKVFRELSMCSDRELLDMGITRSQIRNIAEGGNDF